MGFRVQGLGCMIVRGLQVYQVVAVFPSCQGVWGSRFRFWGEVRKAVKSKPCQNREHEALYTNTTPSV